MFSLSCDQWDPDVAWRAGDNSTFERERATEAETGLHTIKVLGHIHLPVHFFSSLPPTLRVCGRFNTHICVYACVRACVRV